MWPPSCWNRIYDPNDFGVTMELEFVSPVQLRKTTQQLDLSQLNISRRLMD